MKCQLPWFGKFIQMFFLVWFSWTFTFEEILRIKYPMIIVYKLRQVSHVAFVCHASSITL